MNADVSLLVAMDAVKFFTKVYLVAWGVNEVLQFAYWMAR